jgi:GAF domain-containing protein
MSIYLSYDQNTLIYHMKAAAGLSEKNWLELERISWDGIDNIPNKHHGKSGVTLDLSAVPELPFAQTLLSYGIHSCIYCPVEREDAPLGILLIADEKNVDLSEDDISLLKGISNHAASAITNARLFGEANKRLNQIQALHNIDLAITGSHDCESPFKSYWIKLQRSPN